MSVTFIREVKPPVKAVEITLSANDAKLLRAILGSTPAGTLSPELERVHTTLTDEFGWTKAIR
jgi:hypothetical protein